MGKLKIKKLLLTAAVLALFSALFFMARGQQASDFLKRLILPELSAATGRQIIARKMYINLFPLFIGARDLKVLDGRNEIMNIPKIKGYMNLTGLLNKELVLRRLVLSKPDIKTDVSGIQDIAESIKAYLLREKKTPFTAVVKSVILQEGKFSLGFRDSLLEGDGLNAEAILEESGNFANNVYMPGVKFRLKNFSPKIKGWPELKAGVGGTLSFKDKEIEVRSLDMDFYGSSVKADGVYRLSAGSGAGGSSAGGGNFQVQMNILPESLKKIFKLRKEGEGKVYAGGTLNLVGGNLSGSVVNLDLKGGFYAQTLMEMLKVDEKVEGFVDFSGNIQGPLSDLAGKGKAHLRNGNLFNIEVKDMTCDVAYKDNALNFTEGRSVLYNGRAEAEAVVTVVRPTYYSLDIRFFDVDSLPVLNIIGWVPDIPVGKVKGRLNTSGYAFNPSGWFEYRSMRKGDDALGRIERIKGLYSLRDGLLTLADAEALTNTSALSASGNVDINEKRLYLNARLTAADVSDITLPYLSELRGSGEFSGTVTGLFDTPIIEGNMRLRSALFEGYYIGDVNSDMIYRRDHLEVKKLATSAAEQEYSRTIALSGNIRFPQAVKLFEFRKPFYDLSVSARNADLEKTIKFVYRKKLAAYPHGLLGADFRITGAGPEPSYNGTLRINNAGINSYAVADLANMSFSYDYKDFLIRNGLFRKGSSSLSAEGMLSRDARFSFGASGTALFLRDLPFRAAPFDAMFAFTAEGRGTLANPEVILKGTVYRQKISGSEIGEGRLDATLKDRKLAVEAALFDGNVIFKGRADIRDDLPWTAHLDVRPGRYDFLLSSFLKDKPEDLLINLSGSSDMRGNREHFTASADINRLNLNLFSYSFSNDSGIHLEMKDKNMLLPMVKMRSGSASFNLRGNVGLTRGYDLVLEGSSSLSPVKGFFKRIDAVKGDADFVFSVTGEWDNPKINGGVTITNALIGIKDMPHRISSVSGYFFIDENRIVIQKLSGKMGGGDVDVAGIAYLQRFKMRKFYMDAVMSNIGINASKDFALSFNGNISAKGSPESQTVSGEIRLNRLRYNERVEWKSWLLRTKAMERPKGELSALDKTALNIRVYGADNITVNNNIARAHLRADLLLRGTVASPVLLGRIESQSGAVYFRNNEFRIINASADFSDPRRINPSMEIIAETSLKGYNIRMNLEGQVDHFNLSLLSDPPLEEMDILGLLTVGRFGKELKGIEGGIGAGEAASFLTGKMQDVLEERAKTLTGLDRVEVDPYVSKVTGTISPRVTVSKRLLGDRLFVTYSSAVSSSENNVIRLEYILGKNMSLVGIRDEKGSMGSDVKFRFEFK